MAEYGLKENSCKIHFIKAMSGDCFLLEFSDKNCILIDCGYKSTYEMELKPLLKKLNSKGCRISLLVITHMDEDHIGGAIALIEDNGKSDKPNIIAIDDIWFNGIFDVCRNYDFLLSHLTDCLTEKDSKKYEFIRNEMLKLIGNGEGFVSAYQAEAFELLCRNNHYRLNEGAINGLVTDGMKLEIGECKVSVLSPSTNEVDCFAKWIDKSLIGCLGKNYKLENSSFIEYIEKVVIARGKDEEGSCGSEVISAGRSNIQDWIGTSTLAKMNEANRMSIVIEIEFKGKSMLFAGDSESEDWIGRAKSQYNLVKLSHHGTTQPNLKILECIDFNGVIISTNGKKNHPENDLLARLLMKKVDHIYFNYDIRQKENILAYQNECKSMVHFGEDLIEVS